MRASSAKQQFKRARRNKNASSLRTGLPGARGDIKKSEKYQGKETEKGNHLNKKYQADEELGTVVGVQKASIEAYHHRKGERDIDLGIKGQSETVIWDLIKRSIPHGMGSLSRIPGRESGEKRKKGP